MSGWQWLAAAFMVGVLLLSLGFATAEYLRDWRSAREIRRKVAARAANRRPAPGTVVVEGLVVQPVEPSQAPRIVQRHEFGCLGGPMVFDVSTFELELPNRARVWVHLGPDPVVENMERLVPDPPGELPVAPSAPPLRTGLPQAVLTLKGLVRVSGIRAISESRMAPPDARSGTLSIL